MTKRFTRPKSLAAKRVALHDGAILLFVCSFFCLSVRLFVCRQSVLVGHWPDCPAPHWDAQAGGGGTYRVGHLGRTDLLQHKLHSVKDNSLTE